MLHARRVLVEDAGAETSLVQELKGRVSGIIAVRADGDKASRMVVASAKLEAGQALLPERGWPPSKPSSSSSPAAGMTTSAILSARPSSTRTTRS
jgi:hypothetical protein